MALRDSFRENIKRRRRELGLTQQDVADRLDVTRPQVAQTEAGVSAPTLDMVERFAKALDCPALALLVASEESLVEA